MESDMSVSLQRDLICVIIGDFFLIPLRSKPLDLKGLTISNNYVTPQRSILNLHKKQEDDEFKFAEFAMRVRLSGGWDLIDFWVGNFYLHCLLYCNFLLLPDLFASSRVHPHPLPFPPSKRNCLN